MSFTQTLISEKERAELLCYMIASGASKIEQQIASLNNEEVVANLTSIHEEQKKSGESAGSGGDVQESGSGSGEVEGNQETTPRPEIVS